MIFGDKYMSSFLCINTRCTVHRFFFCFLSSWQVRSWFDLPPAMKPWRFLTKNRSEEKIIYAYNKYINFGIACPTIRTATEFSAFWNNQSYSSAFMSFRQELSLSNNSHTSPSVLFTPNLCPAYIHYIVSKNFNAKNSKIIIIFLFEWPDVCVFMSSFPCPQSFFRAPQSLKCHVINDSQPVFPMTHFTFISLPLPPIIFLK